MIIMSVDLGKARTGIAVSDKGEGFAFPKTVINEYNTEKLVQKIADWAKELAAEEIVVGLPKKMDGSLGWRAEECTEIAEKINESAPMAVRAAKVSINNGSETDYHTAYALDIAAYNLLVSSEDRLEGVAAFNEKRKPKWKNQ